MRSGFPFVLPFVALGLCAVPGIQAAEPTNPNLEQAFNQTVRPFVATYCVGCHSGAAPAAGFNLKSFTTLPQVIDDLPHWNAALGRLKSEQMPPKMAKQPPMEARQQIVGWIQQVRQSQAQRNAGDPGIVLARRLSNAEYNYTIRDLTGVDIRPTREFPVDPANTAGFDNSGESLTMSPALFNKYLQAAREVADHMALTPEGIDFCPSSDARRNRPREVRHPAHRRFLQTPAHRLRRLLPSRLALQTSLRAPPASCHAHGGRTLQ